MSCDNHAVILDRAIVAFVFDDELAGFVTSGEGRGRNAGDLLNACNQIIGRCGIPFIGFAEDDEIIAAFVCDRNTVRTLDIMGSASVQDDLLNIRSRFVVDHPCCRFCG